MFEFTKSDLRIEPLDFLFFYPKDKACANHLLCYQRLDVKYYYFTFDALDMMASIRAKKILEAFRGKPPVNRDALAELLVALGAIGLENEAVSEIDINPIKLVEGKPRAVDALVVLK